MANLTYSQLEGVWIQNGGSTALAPTMAAIALAESRGNPKARNDKDNGGSQSSFGLWQISTGTHTPPSPNWADPNVNAKLAVGKYKSQGLKAWGTYTSQAYKAFLANGVPPTTVAGGSGALAGGGSVVPVVSKDDTCAWKLNIRLAPDVCVASKTQVRVVTGVLIMGGGLAIGLVGLFLIVAYGLSKSETAKDVAKVAVAVK